jgi:TIR domain-containing protein
MTTTRTRQGVFVSYSHHDRKWLDRLKIVLKPALGQETIWDDTQITPGASWADEIEHAIASARVAVLLVTPAFLSSDFIVSQELPRIIERQTKEGLSIFWVAVEPALFSHSPLFKYQAANDPSHPLSSLPRAKQEVELVRLAEKIIAAVNVNAVANVLKKVDSFEPQLRAFVEQKPAPAGPTAHGIIARQEPGKDVITVGPETITGDDLAKLDPHSRQLIRAYEDAMNDLFDRFTELEPKRTARDPDVRQRARRESEEVRQDICERWSKILRYLALLGKHLEDHYQHVEFICQQPVKGH